MENSTEILDLLIVGAGPAGLAAAVEAQRGGVRNLLVLEKGPSHSTMIRTFYKEGKRVDARYAGLDAICLGLMCLKDGNRESFLGLMDHVIEQGQIPIHYGTEVWSVVKGADGIFEVKTAAGALHRARFVVVAIGKMGKPNQPDYWKEIPNALKNNKSILFDINTRPLEGASVLVVGGGDSASEYVQMLEPKNRVALSYRRESFAKMNPVNKRILEELIAAGRARALMPSTVSKVEDDAGRPRVSFAEAGHAPETFDAILYGLGGMSPVEFLRTAHVAVDPAKGEPTVNELNETSVEGLYVVGDLLGKGKGGGSIIAGFNSAWKSVRDILGRRMGRPLEPEYVMLDHMKF